MAEAFSELISRRVILVAGKGGVGRTSVSAGIATAAAQCGKRVLVAELREPVMRHRSALAEKFGKRELRRVPEPLAAGVDGVQLCSERGTEHFLVSVFRVPAMARLALRSRAILTLLHAVPSFREMGIFYHFLHHLKELDEDGAPRYDLALIDMPATGHALALTGLPEILLRLVPVGPIARAMREGQAILNDPASGAAYVVTLAEKLPVTESIELLDGLKETGMAVGGVIVNRLPQDPFDERERAALAAMLDGQPFLGRGELKRIDRAEHSLERLRREVSSPLVLIEQIPAAGVALTEAIATSLANA